MNTEKLIKLVELYKGVNPELLYGLSNEKQKYVIDKTVKELALLAESGKAGAGKKLIRELNSSKAFNILEVESILEYGIGYQNLSDKQKKYVKRLELQQEFGHFSRIMNLDGVITGKDVDPIDTVLDFSRFFQLLEERRNDRSKNSTSCFARPVEPITHAVTNSPACGLMEPVNQDNIGALLAVKTPDSHFKPKESMVELNRLVNRFEPKTAIYLFDYLLYLQNHNVDLSFVIAYTSGKDNALEVAGSGNCGILITNPKADRRYEVNVIENTSIGKSSETWDFGKRSQSEIDTLSVEKTNKDTRVYLLHPSAQKVLRLLKKSELEELLNSKQKNGWVNPPNSLVTYLNDHGVISQIVTLKMPSTNITNTDSKSVDHRESVKIIADSPAFRELSKSKELHIETAHIHSDRNPGEEQWECVRYTNEIITILKENKFGGKITMSTMIDEYHVINRLNYKSFMHSLKKRGVKVDEVIMESSPIVRIIALDVLKYLSGNQKSTSIYQIVENGGNVYLEFPDKGIVIELLADANNNPMIGCVLFDVALCLYKSNSEYYRNAYNGLIGLGKKENVHTLLLNYYNKEKSVVKRQKYMESFFVEIPTWKQLEKDAAREQVSLPKSSTLLLNVLAHFYKPQQKKVNMFLTLLGQKPIKSFFYNSKTGEIELV